MRRPALAAVPALAVALLGAGCKHEPAKQGTPKPVVDKLVAALQTAMQDPAVKTRLAELSSDIPSMDKLTPAGLETHLRAEIAKWGPVIKNAGIYAD